MPGKIWPLRSDQPKGKRLSSPTRDQPKPIGDTYSNYQPNRLLLLESEDYEVKDHLKPLCVQ